MKKPNADDSGGVLDVEDDTTRSAVASGSLRERNHRLKEEVRVTKARLQRARKELKRQSYSFKTVVGLSQDLNRSLDWEDLTKFFLLTVMGQVGVSTLVLYYEDENESHTFRFQGCRGIPEESCHPIEFHRDRGLAYRLTREAEFFDLTAHVVDRVLEKDIAKLRRIGFEFVTPIVNKDRLSGFLATGAKINESGYDVGDVLMLSSLCHLAASGFANARLYRQLRETYLSTLRVLINTLEAKHPYTRGHTERVARYATAIARSMNLTKEEREEITFGAVLHDIGKMAVRDSILDKPTDLSEEEWEIVRGHPVVGANILSGMKFLEDVVDLVRYHHERLDGRGYPDGLKGTEIPLGARIIAVADSFDAITSSRTYNMKEGWEEAVRILESKVGTHFDEDVVGHLARIVRSGALKPRSGER